MSSFGGRASGEAKEDKQMILDDLRDSDKMLWQLRLQNLEKEHDRAFGSKPCKRASAKDDIRKAALELIGDVAQCEYEYSGADALSAKVTIGYIVGVKDLAEKMIETIEKEKQNENQ